MHGPFGVHALLFFCDGLLQGHMVNIVVVVIERPIEPAHCFDYDNEHWPACPLARVILNHASRGGQSPPYHNALAFSSTFFDERTIFNKGTLLFIRLK